MFYPTRVPVVIVGGGTDYQINEPYIKFMLLADSVKESWEMDRLAKEAFLYIIATRHACKFNKVEMLGEIVEKCPDVVDGISDEEMVNHLKYLRNSEQKRSTLVSTPELEWVTKYVRTPEARQQAEKIIYLSMLRGDSYWDKRRHEYAWTISKDMQDVLILNSIQDKSIGSKRRIELAKEIDFPAEYLQRLYFRKLLWDRHYDNAAEVGMKNEEDVFIVASKNLNAGYFSDAFELVQRFLPARQDLIDEINRIRAVFKC
ncbi:MAG: hypothetical protein Q8O94_00110 [bacterium]|nr:hypothetical protein [bacterium]